MIIHHEGSRTLKLEQALRGAADWYVHVLNERDTLSDGQRATYYFLRDYNKITPELKIIQLADINKFIVCHHKGINSFDTDEALDNFLSAVLGLADVQLEEGYHNVVAGASENATIQ